MTRMFLCGTRGLIVIHEFVAVAAPGLEDAAGGDGQEHQGC